MASYDERLVQTKRQYPFDKWQDGEDSEAYSAEHCAQMQAIFDDLIQALMAAGEAASVEAKVEAFRVAIEATNALDDDVGMIQTTEREDLCELTNVIAVAAGLDPNHYGNGEGLASEWRDW